VAEHKYHRLCKVIRDRSTDPLGFDRRDLQLIVDLLCPVVKAECTVNLEDLQCQ
jgi:hypothetical protein